MRADLDAQAAPLASQLSEQGSFFQEALQDTVNAEMNIARRDCAKEQACQEADFAAREALLRQLQRMCGHRLLQLSTT